MTTVLSNISPSHMAREKTRFEVSFKSGFLIPEATAKTYFRRAKAFLCAAYKMNCPLYADFSDFSVSSTGTVK